MKSNGIQILNKNQKHWLFRIVFLIPSTYMTNTTFTVESLSTQLNKFVVSFIHNRILLLYLQCTCKYRQVQLIVGSLPLQQQLLSVASQKYWVGSIQNSNPYQGRIQNFGGGIITGTKCCIHSWYSVNEHVNCYIVFMTCMSSSQNITSTVYYDTRNVQTNIITNWEGGRGFSSQSPPPPNLPLHILQCFMNRKMLPFPIAQSCGSIDQEQT